MSATLDLNPIPRHAVQAWVDERNVWIAIPIKGQAPWIDRYPLTAAGLGEALAKMRNYHTVQAGPPVYVAPPRVEITRRVLTPQAGTPEARIALAQAILARLRIQPKRS